MFPILSRREGMMTAMFVSREWKQDQFGIITPAACRVIKTLISAPIPPPIHLTNTQEVN